MMHDGNVFVVPCDGHGIPVCFGDLAAVGGIAAPTDSASGFELSRVGGGHYFGIPVSRPWQP